MQTLPDPQAFLQTGAWGTYQKSLGRKVFFIGGENWKSLLVRHDLPLGKNYLYCPRGPVFEEKRNTQTAQNTNDIRNSIKEFLEKAVGIAKQERSIFLRWDPPLKSNYQPSTTDYRLVKTRSVQPQHTFVVDLAQSEEELLSGMHEKTRYNIRLARRHGVAVRAGNGRDMDAFIALLAQTAKRDKISLHPRDHYMKLAEVLSPADPSAPSAQSPTYNRQPDCPQMPVAELYVAEYQNKMLAAAIVIRYGGIATYLHGASANTNRNVMAPYLLHWHIMQEAKRATCNAYDFWGIDPSTKLRAGDHNSRWAGISRFKRGFGGKEVHFPPSFDATLSLPWYGLYRLLTYFR